MIVGETYVFPLYHILLGYQKKIPFTLCFSSAWLFIDKRQGTEGEIDEFEEVHASRLASSHVKSTSVMHQPKSLKKNDESSGNMHVCKKTPYYSLFSTINNCPVKDTPKKLNDHAQKRGRETGNVYIHYVMLLGDLNQFVYMWHYLNRVIGF